MSVDDTKPKNSDAKPDWLVPPEDFVAGGATVVGTALGGPLAGIGFGVVVKAAGQLLRKVVADRGAARAEAFELEFLRTFDDPKQIDSRFENQDFQEVVFQSFRRAMDAIDTCVLPALGRLTAMYCYRAPDAFFRGVGRLLQDLGPDELFALRQILSAASTAGLPVVSIVSWQKTTGWELLFSKVMPGETDAVVGIQRHPCAVSVLELLRRHALLQEADREGQDIAFAGSYDLAKDQIDRLLLLVERVDVNIHPSNFSDG